MAGSGKGNYEQVMWTRPSLSEPFAWMVRFHSQASFGQNNSHVNDPELDRLMDAYNAAKGIEAQGEAARKIQFRLADKAYAIMLPLPFEFALEQPYVREESL